MIKLKIFRWGDNPGGPAIIIRVLLREAAGSRVREREVTMKAEGAVRWVLDRRMEAASREMGAASRHWTKQENRLSPEPSEGPANNLILAHWDWIWTSDLQNCGFQASKSVPICYQSNMKLIQITIQDYIVYSYYIAIKNYKTVIPKHPSIGGWLNISWYIYIMIYLISIREKSLLFLLSSFICTHKHTLLSRYKFLHTVFGGILFVSKSHHTLYTPAFFFHLIH